MKTAICYPAFTRGNCFWRSSSSHVRQPSRLARLQSSSGGQPTPEQLQAAMKAMQDPKMQAQMAAVQEALKRPEVQQQMAQMQAMMQNQQMQQAMQKLKDDPEFAEVFKEIQKGGMATLMKYWDDPKFLAKLGSKIGDVQPPVAAGPSMAPPAPPEINTLIDAARWGDVEAAEDFLAIGKDVNMRDAEKRTPAHFAVAYDHPKILELLIEAGADMAACDTKNNTPLHYAAGYGRADVIEMLLDAGADVKARNASGKTPADLARLDPRNPVSQDANILARLTK